MKIIEIPVSDILTAFLLGIYLKMVSLQLTPILYIHFVSCFENI